MSSSEGSSGCVPRFSSASTRIGCGAVFSWSRMPRLASKRRPSRVRIWVPALVMVLHEREVAVEFHQVLSSVNEQCRPGDGLVLQREAHGACDVLGRGRAAQGRQFVQLLELLL